MKNDRSFWNEGCNRNLCRVESKTETQKITQRGPERECRYVEGKPGLTGFPLYRCCSGLSPHPLTPTNLILSSGFSGHGSIGQSHFNRFHPIPIFYLESIRFPFPRCSSRHTSSSTSFWSCCCWPSLRSLSHVNRIFPQSVWALPSALPQFPGNLHSLLIQSWRATT